ncbi:hypothetical protein [Hyphomicrobium sp. 802]|nr:hypothetical protein [Hyphomicrobium sp. 802]
MAGTTYQIKLTAEAPALTALVRALVLIRKISATRNRLGSEEEKAR